MATWTIRKTQKFITGFYSNPNMEDITDADYAYGKKVCEDFKIKSLE